MNSDPVTDQPHQRPKSSPLVLVLWLVAALALVALVVEFVVLRPQAQDAVQEQRDRTKAQSVAQQFVVQYNTFDHKALDGYQDSVTDLLSTKFATSFVQEFENIQTLITSGKMVSTDARILKSAVASIDQDSAVVLVAADAKVNTAFDNRVRHFRWQLEMVKVKGEWLVDNFDPVVDPASQTGGAQPLPGADPTELTPSAEPSATQQPSPVQPSPAQSSPGAESSSSPSARLTPSQGSGS